MESSILPTYLFGFLAIIIRMTGLMLMEEAGRGPQEEEEPTECMGSSCYGNFIKLRNVPSTSSKSVNVRRKLCCREREPR